MIGPNIKKEEEELGLMAFIPDHPNSSLKIISKKKETG